MFYNKYNSDDMSPEAKEERNMKANSLKYAIILGLLILVAQSIYYIFNGTYIAALPFFIFWSWCIYKVYRFEFRNKEDIES